MTPIDTMKKAFSVFLLYSILLAGCSSIDKEYIEQSLQKEYSKCGGKIVDFTLIREGLLSNKYTGYAEVTVDKESYYPDVNAVADSDTYYWKNDNVCNVIEASKRAKEYEQEINRQAEEYEREMQRISDEWDQKIKNW